MDFFRTIVTAQESEKKISHRSSIFTMGSCFSDEMARRLQARKFRVMHNPFGILFHPVALENAFLRIVTQEMYQASELFHFKELYLSWDHHSVFNHTKLEVILHQINENIVHAHRFLQKADFVIITLGTSFVYQLISSQLIVANCHKIPNSQFEKILLDSETINNSLQTIVTLVKSINNECTVIFTVSPVRHMKDGFVENNVSKARLIDAVYKITTQNIQTQYFPSYEMIMDDLRDYRFYKEDMIHPNEMALQYIWKQFSKTYFSENTQKRNLEIEKISLGIQHKPFQQNTLAYKEFLYQLMKRCNQLNEELPFNDFAEEILELKKRLNNAY